MMEGSPMVKVGLSRARFVMLAGRIGAGQLRYERYEAALGQVPLVLTLYMTKMPLLESCIAVSQFNPSQWQNG
jgi:hypothetical protein